VGLPCPGVSGADGRRQARPRDRRTGEIIHYEQSLNSAPMSTIPDLQTSLLDLLFEIEGTDIKLIIGGGFGIYLKIDYVRREGARTLLQEWPEPRSTNDIDLFLRPELLIEPVQLKPLALDKLGYQAVPGAEKYQFVKPGPGGTEEGSIKIDILTGPQNRFEGTPVKWKWGQVSV